MKLSNFTAFAIFSTVLTLTGCQSMANTYTTVNNPAQAVTLPLTNEKLQHYVWQLASVTDTAGKPAAQGLFYNANKPLLMKFDKAGKVRFENTCNQLWADYMLTNDNVTVGDFASSRMACDPKLMAMDSLAPSTVNGQFKLTQTDKGEPVLTVTGANQISVFKPVTVK